MNRRMQVAWLALVAGACQCGNDRLMRLPTCEDDNSCYVDAGTPPPPPPPGPCPAVGAITGRVCATDQKTFVNGAKVELEAQDCNGVPVKITTTSEQNGSFQLSRVPPGTWTVRASTGSFTQDNQVTVKAGETLAIPDNQLCVAQKTVRIAVVTGFGDKIEDLLTNLGLTFTLYDGKSGYATGAAPFLADLAQLKKYDIIFFDCAAARSNNSIDLGAKASTIQQNLKAYVEGGGSIYASDWALLFAVAANPGGFEFATLSGAGIKNPLSTNQLMGYAPQTLTATIADPALASFLEKASVQITFPMASSVHWGLMEDVSGIATVLVSAVKADTCSNTACSAKGMAATGIPLAARVKVNSADKPGGQVVYTSFHNVGQSGDDVAKILKYLILNL